jgi:hypothetical protein
MLKSRILYEKHDGSRICQGDILRDFKFQEVINIKGTVKEYFYPYVVIMSQDCDLEQFQKIKSAENLPENDGSTKCTCYLPNIIFAPAFVSEQLKEGKHLKDVHNITQDKLGGDKWKNLLSNHVDRYHHLNADLEIQVQDLIIDFKLYHTLAIEHFLEQYKERYLTSISELFRERLSQRFANFISRIGLPEIITTPAISSAMPPPSTT